ncbi:MAG: hypothetical protein JXA90_00860, partial [Planctomycetes bacterium]|nr:hypothetical protein [Planctomycetota bacterium]
MLKITILLAAAWMGAEGRPADEEILAGAEARIREHRMREVTLKILDDAGQPVPEGARVDIEQTRHEFLFGCNIFALGRLRTEEENKIYADRFAEVFNFATLPFYWWNYERSRGEPDYADTER